MIHSPMRVSRAAAVSPSTGIGSSTTPSADEGGLVRGRARGRDDVAVGNAEPDGLCELADQTGHARRNHDGNPRLAQTGRLGADDVGGSATITAMSSPS